MLTDPVHSAYISGWQRPADRGVVAVGDNGMPVGAAWYRLFGADRPAHGFVAAGVPELIIGVRPMWRAQGVGRALLRELTAAARAEGFARLALSVEHGNFALRLLPLGGVRGRGVDCDARHDGARLR